MTKKIATPSATEATMKTGDLLKVTKLSRSQKTGALLPRQGTFVREVENFGRKLILVDFGLVGEEYLFPNEIVVETRAAECEPVTTGDRVACS